MADDGESGGGGSKLRRCINGTKACYAAARKDPGRAMRLASAISGLLLILGAQRGVHRDVVACMSMLCVGKIGQLHWVAMIACCRNYYMHTCMQSSRWSDARHLQQSADAHTVHKFRVPRMLLIQLACNNRLP
eukprot:1469964-Pleurochrysis_carterae.AAC.1